MPTPYEEQQRRRREAFTARSNTDQQRYLLTLSPAERAQYLASQRANITGEQPPAAQPAPQPAPQAPAGRQAQQPPPELHMHVAAPRVDNRPPLERMGDNVEEAIRDENDSRVAQAREDKRMGFARDMESMRQEGLLKRLQAMNDSSYEQPARRQEGPIRVFDPVSGRFLSGWDHVIENGAAYLDGRRYS